MHIVVQLRIFRIKIICLRVACSRIPFCRSRYSTASHPRLLCIKISCRQNRCQAGKIKIFFHSFSPQHIPEKIAEKQRQEKSRSHGSCVTGNCLLYFLTVSDCKTRFPIKFTPNHAACPISTPYADSLPANHNVTSSPSR